MLEASSSSESSSVRSESSLDMMVDCDPNRSAIGGGLRCEPPLLDPLEPLPCDRGGGGGTNPKYFAQNRRNKTDLNFLFTQNAHFKRQDANFEYEFATSLTFN